MALLDRIKRLLGRPSATGVASDAVSGVNANAGFQSALGAAAPLAAANVATQIAVPIAGANIAQEVAQSPFSQEVIQGTQTEIVNPVDLATQTAQNIPPATSIPAPETQFQTPIQEPTQPTELVLPEVIPQTGVQEQASVSDTYNYDAVDPIEVANASFLTATQAAKEVNEEKNNNIFDNIAFTLRDLDLFFQETTSSQLKYDEKGNAVELVNPSQLYGIDNQSITEVSSLYESIKDELLPENQQRAIDEQFGAGKITVKQFQEDFIPKWMEYYSLDSKFIDKKAKTEERYGLTPVQYLKINNDIKTQIKQNKQKIADGLFEFGLANDNPDEQAYYVQMVTDGYVKKVDEMRPSLIKMAGLVSDENFVSIVYSKDDIKGINDKNSKLIDVYGTQWLQYYKYVAEGEKKGLDGDKYAIETITKAGYLDLNGFLANDKSQKPRLNITEQLAVEENTAELGVYYGPKRVKKALESFSTQRSEGGLLNRSLAISEGIKSLDNIAGGYVLDGLQNILNASSVAGVYVIPKATELIKDYQRSKFPIIDPTLVAGSPTNNNIAAPLGTYARTDSSIGRIGGSLDPRSNTSRAIITASQNIPEMIQFIASIAIGNELAQVSQIKKVSQIAEARPLTQGLISTINTLSKVYLENTAVSALTPSLGAGQTRAGANVDMFLDIGPLTGINGRLRLFKSAKNADGTVANVFGKIGNMLGGDLTTGLSGAEYETLVKTKRAFEIINEQRVSDPSKINFQDADLVKEINDILELEKGKRFTALSSREAIAYADQAKLAQASILDISKQSPEVGNMMSKILLGHEIMKGNVMDFVKETIRLGGVPTDESLNKLALLQRGVQEMIPNSNFNVADMIRNVYQIDAVTFAGYYSGVKVGNTAAGIGGSLKQYIVPQAVKDIIGTKNINEALTLPEANALGLAGEDISDGIITAQGREKLGIVTTQDYFKTISKDSELDNLLDDAVKKGTITQEFADNNRDFTKSISNILSKIIC